MFSKFPTDRTIFFSDAVFAIAMTLLILEIKIPTVAEVETFGIKQILIKRIPGFAGYLISFLVTALFWRGHMQICSFVKTVTNRFIWLNTFLLFFVVLMPFATALYSGYGYYSDFAFGFYSVNLALIGVFSFFLQEEVIRTENLKTEWNSITLTWVRIRSLIVPGVFLLSATLASLFPLTSRWLFLLIFLLHSIGDKIYKKRLLKQGLADS